MEDSRESIPRADTGVANTPFGPRHLLGGWSYLLAGQEINRPCWMPGGILGLRLGSSDLQSLGRYGVCSDCLNVSGVA